MASDRSRSTDRTRHGYTGVVAQQGRVILDRDFNAQQGLSADRIAADALDFVGPCGTPDNGFAISLPPSGSPYWSPPISIPGSPPGTPGGPTDFLIAPGTMYLGGQWVEFPAQQNGVPVTYSYFDQPDWPMPVPPSERELNRELVFLEVIEQEVSAVEDPDLLEVALGGPDTTQRLKLSRRVQRLPVLAADCETAWAAAVKRWAVEGWKFDPATMRLMPEVRLQIGFNADITTSTSPCDPVATGGFLGTDNQLIRLRIANPGKGAQLVWGYDNASFLYRVTSVSSDGTTLTLAADPPDAFHVPQTGQLVELLRTAAVLAQEPDESDSSGQTNILRVVADADGVFRQLKQPYGPVPGGTGNAIVLTEVLDMSLKPLPLFMRVWQAAQPMGASGGTIAIQESLIDPNTGVATIVNDTGLTADITVPKGGKLPDGVFWQVAVRPSTPQGVYPEDLLTAPQPPDGPRRWVCPLAVIDWSAEGGPTITDCRKRFENLVTLSRRKPGCCTVAISKGDVTAATPLQSMIDKAAALGRARQQTVTVCLAPDEYLLPAPLTLDSKHDGLILESCGGGATLRADSKADPAGFASGLVILNGVQSVTLRGLTLIPPLADISAGILRDILARLKQDGFDQAAQVLRRPLVSFGVRAMNAGNLTLDQCAIELAPPDNFVLAADLLAAAMFLQGDCSGLTIRGCALSSTFTPTYTRLTVAADAAAPKALDVFNRVMLQHVGSPASPPAGSPPGSPTIEQRVSAAFDVITAKRLAVDVVAPRFVVVAVGVLAADTIGAVCAIGAATLRDTTIVGFTFATWFSAALRSLRLQDNDVSGGVAGLWLELPGAHAPDAPAKGTDTYNQAMLLFEEYQLLVGFAGAFPPPPGSAPPSGRFPMPVFTLLLTGNQVRMRLPSRTDGASAALMLALYRGPVEQDISSVIVSANVFGGGMATVNGTTSAVPAAQLTMPLGLPCSITGNVISNQSLSSDAPSLWLTVGNSQDGTRLLAVTGNALQGRSDLEFLHRLLQPSGWSPLLNADQA